jgi:hypothetical protein
MTQVLDILLRHLVSDVIRLPNCERYNRQFHPVDLENSQHLSSKHGSEIDRFLR